MLLYRETVFNPARRAVYHFVFMIAVQSCKGINIMHQIDSGIRRSDSERVGQAFIYMHPNVSDSRFIQLKARIQIG